MSNVPQDPHIQIVTLSSKLIASKLRQSWWHHYDMIRVAVSDTHLQSNIWGYMHNDWPGHYSCTVKKYYMQLKNHSIFQSWVFNCGILLHTIQATNLKFTADVLFFEHSKWFSLCCYISRTKSKNLSRFVSTNVRLFYFVRICFTSSRIFHVVSLCSREQRYWHSSLQQKLLSGHNTASMTSWANFKPCWRTSR